MRVVLWGGTGQAKVVAAGLGADHEVVLVVDVDTAVKSPLDGVPILHDAAAVGRVVEKVGANAYVVTIGGSRGRDRLHVACELDSLDLVPLTVVHPRAWVDPSARLGPGSQISALAGVGVEAVIGAHCIINTNATVDHETVLGDGVHIMPGATVAGCVSIGEAATIGSNATVLPRLSVGRDAVVGAGAVVIRDVAAGDVVIGVPAKPQNAQERGLRTSSRLTQT